MTKLLNFFALSGLYLALAAPGCSKSERLPTTRQATIKGSLSNAGKSLETDTIITFICDEHGATFGAKIDALGKFQIIPAVKSIGIPAGRYKVVVNSPQPANAPVGSEQYTEMMKASAPANAKTKAAENPNIPSSVTNVGTTKIILEVQEGDNNFDIDLAKFAK